jgi:hypothetical protein
MSLAHGSPEFDSPPYRLEAPPDELWTLDRRCVEFGVGRSAIWGLIAGGRLPRPWTHRRRKPLWAPEQVRPALMRYRHRHQST